MNYVSIKTEYYVKNFLKIFINNYKNIIYALNILNKQMS